MRNISVVIINHNTRQDVGTCIRSVLSDGATDVIVADAASSDGSVDFVRHEFPGVRVAALSDNRGYGATSNAAIGEIDSPYVLLLNSDTVVARGTLDALARYLDEHGEAAIAGPLLREPGGGLQRSCYPFPGTLRWILDNDTTAGLARRLGWLRRLSLRAWEHDRPRAVPWVKGAALAIRRSDFVAVNGFDERYFLYFEETDLCARLWERGRETHFAPVGEVVHLGERSTRQYGERMRAQLCESLERYFRSRYGPVRAGLLARCYRLFRRFRNVSANNRTESDFSCAKSC